MRSRAAAASCLVLGLAGFVTTYALFVRTARGQRLDERLHLDSPGQTSWRLLHAYNAHLLVGEVVVLAVILIAALSRRQPRRGLLCVLLPLATVAVAEVGKRGLPRADLVPDGLSTVANTYPSGHVGFAAATVAAVLLCVPVWWRPAVAAVGGIAVSAVVVATVQAHWHRASDGIGSIFVVLALSGLVVLLSPVRPPPRVGPVPSARSLATSSRG